MILLYDVCLSKRLCNDLLLAYLPPAVKRFCFFSFLLFAEVSKLYAEALRHKAKAGETFDVRDFFIDARIELGMRFPQPFDFFEPRIKRRAVFSVCKLFQRTGDERNKSAAFFAPVHIRQQFRQLIFFRFTRARKKNIVQRTESRCGKRGVLRRI